MTTARATAALLILAAAFASLFALLAPSGDARADTRAPAPAAVTATLSGPDAAVLAAAAPQGTEALSPAQATEALLAADRVCEGLTAAVPEGFMIRTVADESGLPLDLAHAFVEAAMTRCGVA